MTARDLALSAVGGEHDGLRLIGWLFDGRQLLLSIKQKNGK